MTKGSERQYALKILEDFQTKNKFLNQLVDDYFYVYEFDKQQKSFISRLVFGIIENQLYIDFCLNEVSTIKTLKMKPVILNILRMGVYQLLFMDKIPSHAAINEAVKLTQKRKFVNLKGFVNGVLRNIERQKQSFDDALNRLERNDYLSIKYSIKKELVEYLLEQFSDTTLEEFLYHSQGVKKTCLYTNTLKQSSEQLKRSLSQRGTIEDGHLFEESFYLSDYDKLDRLPEFIDGRFFVQDESSALVGHLVNPTETMKILDVCAAPGGKSINMAIKMRNKGQIISCDVSEIKVQKIIENCSRLGITTISPKVMDATVYNEEYEQAFDVVLADVPCSGLGILRTKPDIKQNMSVEKIKSLITIQKSILLNVKKYVKVDGVLVYSTCTINPNENSAQIIEFLSENPNFELLDIAKENLDNDVNHRLKDLVKDKWLQLMTNPDSTDGFFIAKLKRIKE